MEIHCSVPALLLGLAASLGAYAGFGETDPTYFFYGGCNAVTPREDGSAYVDSPNASGVAVTRLTPQGIPDGAWGVGGSVAYSAGQSTQVHQVLLGKDGDLFVIDMNFSLQIGGISHVTSDGRLDATFGAAGRVPTPYVASAALQPDGKIVALVNDGGSAKFLRFTPEGRPDTGFGHGGSIAVPGVNAFFTVYGWAIREEAAGGRALLRAAPVQLTLARFDRHRVSMNSRSAFAV